MTNTWIKMCKTGFLDGITVTLLPTGETNIPQSDIDNALKAANGGEVHPEEWD